MSGTSPAEPRSDTVEAPPPPPPVEPRPEVEADQPKHRPFWRELPVLVVVAFVIALVLKSFVLQAFYIPSASMEPTLLVGDRVLVEKISYRFGEPGRGHVVVFEKDLGGAVVEEADGSVLDKIGDAFKGLFGFPTGSAQDFIKRVVAVGGDTVEGRDGRVFVNGEPVDEPYLPEGTETSTFGPVDVPEGMIFVMGDNRGNSDDSRNFGPVPVDTVVGRAFLLIWPPSDFATL
ncbi:MAG: signal peptidase I [Actinomycetota bacterium]